MKKSDLRKRRVAFHRAQRKSFQDPTLSKGVQRGIPSRHQITWMTKESQRGAISEVNYEGFRILIYRIDPGRRLYLFVAEQGKSIWHWYERKLVDTKSDTVRRILRDRIPQILFLSFGFNP